MVYALGVLVFGLMVAAVVLAPLRPGARAERREDERRADLEAARESKYSEIRDLRLDHQMGKLSEQDFEAADAELSAQAVAILRRLDDLDPPV